jgi:hypothetical protein
MRKLPEATATGAEDIGHLLPKPRLRHMWQIFMGAVTVRSERTEPQVSKENTYRARILSRAGSIARDCCTLPEKARLCGRHV